MNEAHGILKKLGNTGIPIICASDHPDRTPEQYDIVIGQACFEKNWNAGRLVDIAEFINLSVGHHVFAFKEYLSEIGVHVPQK